MGVIPLLPLVLISRRGVGFAHALPLRRLAMINVNPFGGENFFLPTA
jgi:hypothetical protein